MRASSDLAQDPVADTGAEDAVTTETVVVPPTELELFLRREVELREKLRRQVVAYERQLAEHGELTERQEEIAARAASVEAAEAKLADRLAALEDGAAPSEDRAELE